MAKAAGADDIVDVVVPRAAIPAYMAAVAAVAEEHGALITGCGHVGTATSTCRSSSPTPTQRAEVLRAMFRAGMDLGGAISGEHGIGTEKKKYFLELEDPVKVELMRADQSGPSTPTGSSAPATCSTDDGAARPMNGAQALIRTLVGCGVDVCFTNPGTSEMHFVAALDDVPEMRAVLGLFEGVVTGAADGYGRMAGRPAATLLHLGPGLGNGIANLHNARRARTPLVNVVGDHATTHLRLRPAPGLRHREPGPTGVALVPVVVRTAEALAGRRRRRRARPPAARPAGWPRWWCRPTCRGPRPASPRSSRLKAGARQPCDADAVDGAAKALRSGEPAVVLVGGGATASARGLAAAQPGGRRPRGPSFCARRSRPASNGGRGCRPVERLGYLAEFTMAQLEGARHLVLADAVAPVSFFAYPGHPRLPRARGVRGPRPGRRAGDDVAGALEALADVAGGAGRRRRAPGRRLRPERPTGALDAPRRWQPPSGRCSPRAPSCRDEANTSGIFVPGATRRRAPSTTGSVSPAGAIGQGMPVATGAAVACPGPPGALPRSRRQRHVHAAVAVDPGPRGPRRHHRDLQQRLLRHLGAGARAGWGPAIPGPRARGMLDLGRPDLDFVALAPGDGGARHPGHHGRGVHRPARARLSTSPGPPSSKPSSAEATAVGAGLCDMSRHRRRPERRCRRGRRRRRDEALLDVVTSASVACGVHAGTPTPCAARVEAAAARGVVVGAHPSYPDRAGFGRRPMDLPAGAGHRGGPRPARRAWRPWRTSVGTGALREAPRRALPPHGRRRGVRGGRGRGAAPGRTTSCCWPRRGRVAVAVAGAPGVAVATEAFADRAYRADGALVARGDPGAVLTDPEVVAGRALGIASTTA